MGKCILLRACSQTEDGNSVRVLMSEGKIDKNVQDIIARNHPHLGVVYSGQ